MSRVGGRCGPCQRAQYFQIKECEFEINTYPNKYIHVYMYIYICIYIYAYVYVYIFVPSLIM